MISVSEITVSIEDEKHLFSKESSFLVYSSLYFGLKAVEFMEELLMVLLRTISNWRSSSSDLFMSSSHLHLSLSNRDIIYKDD